MPSVRVKENEYFDAALRRFKRACEKAGILTELRRREFYEKPTQERKRKKAAAVKRHLKKISRDDANRKRLYELHPLLAEGSAMSLKGQITEDMKSAMKAGEKDRLRVVRLILAAIKQIEVDTRAELDDTAVLGVITKMVKQRRDSVEQFENGNREDLAAIERAEIVVLDTYLPEQLSADEVAVMVDDVIQAAGATGIRDMGKVMGQIKAKAAGRADMGAVSAVIKERLNAL